MSLTNAKIVCLALAATAVAATAHAQTAAGYGFARAQANAMTASVATRDAYGNTVQTDGQIMTGTDNSIYANTKTFGAGDTYAGAGASGGTTTTGNMLHVVTAADTAFDHSTQTHNGAVTAQTNETAGGDSTASSLNGQVNLNGF